MTSPPTALRPKNPDSFHDLLIVFTRYPTAGSVKTRLIPKLGAAGAVRLQREMTRHILTRARELRPDIDLEVHADGTDVLALQRLYGSDLIVRPQASGDLGKRMLKAFQTAYAQRARRTVLIGTDCPLITPALIRQAFDLLSSHDCVLGPAKDGGYYLIGLKEPVRALFEGLTWGHGDVLNETLNRAQAAGISTALLECLPDIDRPEDLCIWRQTISEAGPRIAVIIPVLNEEDSIPGTLSSIRQGTNMETIVVDGGSTDQTCKLAATRRPVISCQRGRAVQMNTGARSTSAEILFFLHADTRLPLNYDRHIREALADSRNVAGAFSLGHEANNLPLKIIEIGANVRSRRLKLPYGDQGFFLWAADFKALGGFPELPIMEDAAFIWALKEQGRIVTLPQKVMSSARRYEHFGVLPTWIINQCVIMSFLKGADPDELAHRYRSRAGLYSWLRLVWDTYRQNQPGDDEIP